MRDYRNNINPNHLMKKFFSRFLGKLKNTIQKLDQRDIVFGIIIVNTIFLLVIIYFRFAIYDEKLFLHETVMMSEILKQGKWIGNYGVGVHGFIFKLPIALIFMLTGPNIYIATSFHVILASLTAWIFYLLISKNLKIKNWVIIAVILLITNYTFFSYSTTFHREIPVLFSLVLFTYYLIKDNKKVLLNGLLLLLILEAKEYVFFAVLGPLLIYLFVVNFDGFKKIAFSILNTAKTFLLLLVPSIIYLFLMFYTSLIPINMFNASFLGLTTSGFDYQMRHAIPENALSDMSTYTNSNIGYNFTQEIIEGEGEENVEEDKNIFERVKISTITILGYTLGYFEKFLYIVNYSFQGIPIIILIPSLVSSVYLFKKWYRDNKKLLFLNIFYWCYLVIYMIRSSHQRYILTIIPFAIIFLIYFLINTVKNKKEFRPYFIITLVLSSISMVITVFYQDLTNVKVLFNIVSFAVILSLLFVLFFSKKYKKYIVNVIMLFIIASSVFVSSFAIFTKNQIYKSQLWGINGEADKIAELLDPEDVIFIDCKSSVNSEFTYLVNIFRANNYLPIEWHWVLDEQKIDRKLDAIETKQNFYYVLDIEDMEKFKSNIKENEIL